MNDEGKGKWIFLSAVVTGICAIVAAIVTITPQFILRSTPAFTITPQFILRSTPASTEVEHVKITPTPIQIVPISKKVKVPNLLELGVSDAENRLKALGLAPQRVETINQFGAGSVIEQFPEANTVLSEGSIVTITISIGIPATLTSVPSTPTPTSVPSAPTPIIEVINIDVYAYQNSLILNPLDTGIYINAGDFLSIKVSNDDIWSAGGGPRTSNADGLGPNNQYGRNYGYYTYNGFSFYYGSLVGQIGNGNYFLIGTDFNQTVHGSGRLYLLYWDENYSDNSGYVTANINHSTSSNK